MDQIEAADAIFGETGLPRSLLRARSLDFSGSTLLLSVHQAGAKLILSAPADNGLVIQCLALKEFELAKEASMLAAPS